MISRDAIDISNEDEETVNYSEDIRIDNLKVNNIISNDDITPYKFSLCILLIHYVRCYNHDHINEDLPLPNMTDEEKQDLELLCELFDNNREEFGGEDCHLTMNHLNELGLFLHQKIDIHDTYLEPSLKELVSSMINELGTIGIYCFRHLYEALHGLTNLDDLFVAFSTIVQTLSYSINPSDEPQLRLMHPSSIFGMFIRRVQLAFEQLMFSQVGELYEQICHYRQINMQLDNNNHIPSIISTDHLQRYIIEQINDIQKKLILKQIKGDEIEEIINNIIKTSHDLPEVHFLHFLNCLYHRQWDNAVDNLHRYFDLIARSVDPDDFSPQKTHFAVLNLALMHYAFGHQDECLHILEEAIRVAQQKSNAHCMSHALALLVKLAASTGDNNKVRRLLRRCLFDENNEQMDSMTSKMVTQAWLNMAKFELQSNVSNRSNDDKNPLYIWACLSKSLKASMEFDHQDLIGMEHVIRSLVWKVFGNSTLSYVWAETESKAEDKFDPDIVSQSLLEMGTNPNCQHDLIESILSSPLLEYHTLVSNENWSLELSPTQHLDTLILLRFDWAYLRGDINTAELLVNRLKTIMPHQEFNFALKIELDLLKARLAFLKGHYNEAHSRAFTLLTKCENAQELLLVVRILLFITYTHIEVDEAVTALPHVLRCLSICKVNQFAQLEWESTLAIGEVHYAIGSFNECIECVEQVLPAILENTPINIQVKALHLLAKCLLETNEQKRAIYYLNEAVKCLADSPIQLKRYEADVNQLLTQLNA